MIRKVITVPSRLYNLPEEQYVRNDIYAFENSKYSNLPQSIVRFLQKLPLKWLTKIACKYRPFIDDIVVIDNDYDLPESIKQYVKPYYVKLYNTKYATCVYPNINRDSIEGSLSDYLKELDNQHENKFVIGSLPNYWSDDVWVHIFDGIVLDDFYKLYFKSGLSKEIIFRYLKDTEYYYSIDNKAIEKQVEEILNRH